MATFFDKVKSARKLGEAPIRTRFHYENNEITLKNSLVNAYVRSKIVTGFAFRSYRRFPMMYIVRFAKNTSAS